MSFAPQPEREKKAIAAAKAPPVRLDPVFPWRALEFDLEAFDVLRDPPLPPDSQTSGDD